MSQNVLPPPPSNHGLTSMFAGAESEHSSHWQRLWDKGDFLPFDRGFPNPALEDVLISRTNVIGTPLQNTDGSRRVRRKTALVPGCGRGYDVLLLASFGYDAYGLEISETAVQRCREEQKRNGHKYPVRNQEVGLGKAQFLLGDWFDHFAWKNDAGDIEDIRGFDLIYDYTFLCALPPSLRPAWSEQMKNLLRLNGHLICLEFPTQKSPQSGGPPFALPPEVYLAHLSHPGEKIFYAENGRVQLPDMVTPIRDGFERLAHWQPERTHEVGKGTDWVSIWCYHD